MVVSGLAEGIDTVAHNTAMNAGGRTIAVLGTPLDRAYPKSNEALLARIVGEHLAVSQFASGTPVSRGNFPQRNRTMALMSHASVIIEAGKKSGTQHQGWESIRLGRPLFIMASVVADNRLGWPQKMMDYGAVSLELSESSAIADVLPVFASYAGLDGVV